MPRLSDFAFPKIPPKEIVPAILLGLAGLGLNTLELNLGWGMHFIFGNALIFVFIRLLAPPSTILAVAISSIWTIILWHHPWAWIVWVCEAAFIAYYARRTSPVLSDVIFWFVLGAPLLLFFYGNLLDVDQTSLWLVAVKQTANGILNVVLGGIFYLVLWLINPLRKFSHWPKIKIENFVITLLMGTVLIPTTAYLALDAPGRENAAKAEAGERLTSRLRETDARVGAWMESRSAFLETNADGAFLGNGPSNNAFGAKILSEFDQISVLKKGWRERLSMSPERDTAEEIVAAYDKSVTRARQGPQLVTITPRDTRNGVYFALVVPLGSDPQSDMVVARLDNKTLHDLVEIPHSHSGTRLFLYNANQDAIPLTHASSDVRSMVGSMTKGERALASRTAVLLTDVDYGNAIMSDLRDTQIARSAVLSAIPDWQVLAVAPMQPVIIKAREAQLIQFLALIAFVFLIALIASLISMRISHTLRRVSQSAANLVSSDARQNAGDGIIIEEVSNISGRIATAGTSFGYERRALATYQRRLTSIAEHAPVVLYAFKVVNGEGTDVTYRSPSVEKILGYTTNEASAVTWWRDAVHQDDYENCIARFSNVEPGNVYNAEYRIRHRNGQYIWVYDTLSVEYNSGAGELEAVGLMIDISERKAAADQLLQADKMASLGRLISGTAHELNQPLNFIKMAASNLRENAVRGRLETEKFIPKLESVLTQVERASSILLQMRIFGRTSKEAPSAINIQDTVEAVILMAEPQMEFDGTQVVMQVKASDIYVQAFPVMLEQVLLNLVINANDAIRSQHSGSDSAGGEIKITIDRNEGSAIITVADNGPGIAADVLPKIFEPFFTTKPPQEGTGLGLSISYGIIRDLGGVLRAKSSRNGARFIIELPLADAAAAKAA
jgi:PAS domain S-box-containing protein